MALSAAAVRTAPSGHIFVAPTGTAEPDDITTPLDAALLEFGYATPDGVSLTPNVEVEDIMAWQTVAPILSMITGFVFEISFTLMELNQVVTSAFFAGSEWTNSAGVGRLDISSNPGTQERLLVIEWTDNQGYDYRLVVPRAQMTNREAMNLVRGDSTNSGLTFKALDDDGVTGYLLTNNPLLIPAS